MVKLSLASVAVALALGSTEAKPCGGSTSSSWENIGTDGLYMDVDTTGCTWAGSPVFVPSIVGDAAHWALAGVSTVRHANSDGFRMFVKHPVLKGPYLKYYANQYNWAVNWLGDDGSGAGLSEAGNTGWAQHDNKTVYADIDTSAAQFSGTPSYVTSFYGEADGIVGVANVYQASATSFRVYVVSPTDITAARAETDSWRVGWMGSEASFLAGSSSTTWKYQCKNGEALCPSTTLVQDVDTSAKALATASPVYVAALSAEKVLPGFLGVRGSSAIYSPSATGFKMILEGTPLALDAAKNGWRVNYLAFEHPVDCETDSYADHGGWSACSETCGAGTQSRSRDMTKPPNYSGKCVTSEQRSCTGVTCDVDCAMSPWTAWTACSETCGAGLASRSRTVDMQLEFAGKPCTGLLNDTMVCNAGSCPVDCQVSQWSDWGPCSKSCGYGERERVRVVLKTGKTGGYTCPSLSQYSSCNVHFCPIDCDVGLFGYWTECSESCGVNGKTSHTRGVVTKAAHNGAACPELTETKQCNRKECPRDCTSGQWSDWSECDKTCATGNQFRVRNVTSVAAYGGKECPTMMKEDKTCDAGVCPVHCAVGSWTAFSVCTLTCGQGQKTRARNITSTNLLDSICPSDTETLYCNEQSCPVDCELSDWVEQNAVCSKQCADATGAGTRTYRKTIDVTPLFGGKPCTAVVRHDTCNDFTCPQDCQLSRWGNWLSCSKSCGTGSQSRHRTVIAVATNNGTCPTEQTQTRDCSEALCPVDCEITVWSEWSYCSQSCGGGNQTRTRSITVHSAENGRQCDTNLVEQQECNKLVCPTVHCKVDLWGLWGPCSKSCGSGNQTRVREITEEPINGGDACPVLEQMQGCNNFTCPVDCVLGDWNDFAGSTCSRSCGGGIRIAQRNITTHPANGGRACVQSNHLTPCNEHKCPVDCVVSRWTPYDACSETCGVIGERVSVRNVTTPVAFGGKICPVQERKKDCYEGACPVNCTVSLFGDWSGCSKSCGGGFYSRSRTIENKANHSGAICPELHERDVCNEFECPVDCITSDWTEYGACTESCGSGGTRRKTREVIPGELGTLGAFHGGRPCPSNDGLFEDAPCNVRLCPVDCEVSPNWAYGPCSTSCGAYGVQTLTRDVDVHPANGGNDCPSLRKEEPCYRGACPIHCEVSMWSEWGECDKSCDEGQKTRTRSIITPHQYGGQVCTSILSDDQPCNSQACPINCVVSNWTTWEPTVSSKTPMLTRTRYPTTEPLRGGSPCPALISTKADWCTATTAVAGEWSACTKQCGSGHQYRMRYHEMCSRISAVKYSYHFRQGRICNEYHCTGSAGNADSPVVEVTVPQISTRRLDEASGAWKAVDSAGMAEHGLPAGHWQKFAN
jgi:hypothetical protein